MKVSSVPSKDFSLDGLSVFNYIFEKQLKCLLRHFRLIILYPHLRFLILITVSILKVWSSSENLEKS